MKSSIQPDHHNWDPRYPSVGIYARTFMGDPRINKKQMDEIANAVKFDEKALVMGIDENSLPVVRARVGMPSFSKSWAIKRNGDPVTPGAIYEVWGAPELVRGN